MLLIVALSGCTASQRLQLTDTASLQRVSVSPEIYIPASPYYFLADRPGAMLINNVASAVAGASAGLASNASLTSLTAFQPVAVEAAIMRHDISVKSIVLEEFRRAVAESRRFDLVPNRSDEQAQFQLEVVKFGLIKPMGPHMKMRPVIELRAWMIDATGKRLWLSQKRVGAGNASLPLHPLDDWGADPDLLRDGYRKAAYAVARALLVELEG